jgi:uncharacterized protein HemX
MSPLTSQYAGPVLVVAALFLGLACYYAAEFRAWRRDRRLDARVREVVRTATPEELAQWLPRETAPALASTSTGESA